MIKTDIKILVAHNISIASECKNTMHKTVMSNLIDSSNRLILLFPVAISALLIEEAMGRKPKKTHSSLRKNKQGSHFSVRIDLINGSETANKPKASGNIMNVLRCVILFISALSF